MDDKVENAICMTIQGGVIEGKVGHDWNTLLCRPCQNNEYTFPSVLGNLSIQKEHSILWWSLWHGSSLALDHTMGGAEAILGKGYCSQTLKWKSSSMGFSISTYSMSVLSPTWQRSAHLIHDVWWRDEDNEELIEQEMTSKAFGLSAPLLTVFKIIFLSQAFFIQFLLHIRQPPKP